MQEIQVICINQKSIKMTDFSYYDSDNNKLYQRATLYEQKKNLVNLIFNELWNEEDLK